MKKMFMYVMAAMLVLAPIAVSAQFQPGYDESPDNASVGASGLSEISIRDMITLIMNWLLYLLAALAVLGFVLAGILYITAAGDEGKTEKAKGLITYSIIGLVVALLGLVIVRTVSNLVGVGATGEL